MFYIQNIIHHFTTIISKKKTYWIGLLLLLSILISLNNYNSVDAFLPSNLSGFYLYLNNLFYTTDISNGFSTYYLLGAMSCLLLDISPEVFLWFQPGALLTPLALFGIYYALSKKPLLSIGMVYLYSFLDTNFNSHYFFAHLPGSLIYYTLLLGIIICLLRKDIDYRALLLGTILVISLNFASYNNMMCMLLFSISLLFILIIKYILERRCERHDIHILRIIRNITTFIIISVFIYVIAEVFVSVILPYLENQTIVEATAFDLIYQKMLGPLLGVETHISPYSDVLHYNSSWGSIFGVVKYIIAGFIIINYIIYIIKTVLLDKYNLQYLDCFCLAITFTYGCFFLMRAIASAIQLELIFFPTIIIFIRIMSYFALNNQHPNEQTISYSKFPLNTKRLISLTLVIFSICTIVPYVDIYSIDTGIDKYSGNTDDVTTYPQHVLSSSWIDTHIAPISSGISGIKTDVYTRGLTQLYFISHNMITDPNEIVTKYQYQYLSLSDIQDLIYNRDIIGSDYVIQNMNLKSLTVGVHFEYARAWTKMKDMYEHNENYNLIYSNEGVNIISGVLN